MGKRDQTGAQGLWDSRAGGRSSMCCKLYRLLSFLMGYFLLKKDIEH